MPYIIPCINRRIPKNYDATYKNTMGIDQVYYVLGLRSADLYMPFVIMLTDTILDMARSGVSMSYFPRRHRCISNSYSGPRAIRILCGVQTARCSSSHGTPHAIRIAYNQIAWYSPLPSVRPPRASSTELLVHEYMILLGRPPMRVYS